MARRLMTSDLIMAGRLRVASVARRQEGEERPLQGPVRAQLADGSRRPRPLWCIAASSAEGFSAGRSEGARLQDRWGYISLCPWEPRRWPRTGGQGVKRECWNRAPPSLRVGTPELPQTAPKARDRPPPQSRMTSRVNHSEAPSSLPMSTIDQRLPADGRLMPVLKKVHSKPRSRSPKVQTSLPSQWPLALSDPARGCRWLCGNRATDIGSRTPQALSCGRGRCSKIRR